MEVDFPSQVNENMRDMSGSQIRKSIKRSKAAETDAMLEQDISNTKKVRKQPETIVTDLSKSTSCMGESLMYILLNHNTERNRKSTSDALRGHPDYE